MTALNDLIRETRELAVDMATAVNGRAKTDLSNVDGATGRAALDAAKADLSNVDPATGRTALGIPSLIDYAYNTFPITLNVYQESGETTRFGAYRQRFTSSGGHVDQERSGVCLEMRVEGSGDTVAPYITSSDTALTISAIKDDWNTTTTPGEVDGLNIVVRNGGGGKSDSAAILANVGTTDSFGVAMEATTVGFAPTTGAIVELIQTQIGVVDRANDVQLGFFAEARTGADLSAAFRSENPGGGGGNWLRAFEVMNAGFRSMAIGGVDGSIQLWPTASTADDYTLVNDGGVLEARRADDLPILQLDQGGNAVVGYGEVATSAGSGFLYLPAVSGTPTGTPTTYTGRVPLVFNTTAGRLQAYYGAAWHFVAFT